MPFRSHRYDSLLQEEGHDHAGCCRRGDGPGADRDPLRSIGVPFAIDLYSEIYVNLHKFPKVAIVGDSMRPNMDDNGIMFIGLMQFLVDSNSLEYRSIRSGCERYRPDAVASYST